MNRSLDSVKKNLSGMRAEAEGLALGLAIRQVGEFVKKNLDWAGSLGETAQQIGVTTRELQVFRAIGGQVGVTQEEMDAGLQKLTVSLGKASVGAKAQNEAFAALGISVRDSSGHVKGTGAVVEEVADKLSKIADPAQRAAAEVAIFGRAGQKLDTILTGGKKGIEEYARRAEEMGMILSDDLVNAADAASDKMAELNAQLTANIAKAVAQNAGAILGLAGALTSLTTNALTFINTYPKLAGALAGAAIGASRFGLPGAVIGGGVGTIGGALMGRSSANNNMDLNFRRQELDKSMRELDARRAASRGEGGLFTLRRSSADGGNLASQVKEVQRQTALTRQATAQFLTSRNKAVVPPVDLPNFLAGGGGGGGGGRKGRTPKVAKDPLENAAERFAQEMARIDEDILRVKTDSLTNVQAIAAAEKDVLAKQIDQANMAIQKDVADKRITEVQGQQIQLENAILAAAKSAQIDREAQAETIRRSTDISVAANDNERDILQAQESLAETSDQRRILGMKLLDLDKEAERLKLQETINLAKIGKATEEQARIAQERLGKLDTIYSLKGQGVTNSTRTPLEQYLNETDPAKINERVQSLVVDELNAVHHGITDAIANSLGVQDPLLRGLIDMFIEQVLIRPIAQALQNAQGSGGGGLFGNLLGLGAGLLGGGFSGVSSAAVNATLDAIPIMPAFAGFASGTNSAPPGTAWVGENGPELLRFRGGESVFNMNQLRSAANNNGGNTYHINVTGGRNDGDRRETAAQVQRVIRQEQARNMRMGA